MIDTSMTASDGLTIMITLKMDQIKLVLKKTTRYFPNNNCYTVSAETQTIQHKIQLEFYYGNYDCLCKPPTFDLFINQ